MAKEKVYVVKSAEVVAETGAPQAILRICLVGKKDTDKLAPLDVSICVRAGAAGQVLDLLTEP